MSNKLPFSKLGLVKNQDVIEIDFKDQKIAVLKYLDIMSKSKLINAAVHSAVIRGIVDEVLVDAYLHMFIVEHYTNISFTPKQRDNLLETFDLLEANGVFDLIISVMDPAEYNYIFSTAKKLMVNLNEYNRTIISVIQDPEALIEKLSKKLPSGQ